MKRPRTDKAAVYEVQPNQALLQALVLAYSAAVADASGAESHTFVGHDPLTELCDLSDAIRGGRSANSRPTANDLRKLAAAVFRRCLEILGEPHGGPHDAVAPPTPGG